MPGSLDDLLDGCLVECTNVRKDSRKEVGKKEKRLEKRREEGGKQRRKEEINEGK